MGLVASVPSEIVDFRSDPSTKFTFTKPEPILSWGDESEEAEERGVKRKKTRDHDRQERLHRKRFKNAPAIICATDQEANRSKHTSSLKHIFLSSQESPMFELGDRKKWMTYTKGSSLRIVTPRRHRKSKESLISHGESTEVSEEPAISTSSDISSGHDDSIATDETTDTTPLFKTVEAGDSLRLKTGHERESKSNGSKCDRTVSRRLPSVDVVTEIKPDASGSDIIALMSTLDIDHRKGASPKKDESTIDLRVKPSSSGDDCEALSSFNSAIPRRVLSRRGKMWRQAVKINDDDNDSVHSDLCRVKGSDCLFPIVERSDEKEEKGRLKLEDRVKDALPSGHPLRRVTLDEFKRSNRKKII